MTRKVVILRADRHRMMRADDEAILRCRQAKVIMAAPPGRAMARAGQFSAFMRQGGWRWLCPPFCFCTGI